jgi:hypothetical protein
MRTAGLAAASTLLVASVRAARLCRVLPGQQSVVEGSRRQRASDGLVIDPRADGPRATPLRNSGSGCTGDQRCSRSTKM